MGQATILGIADSPKFCPITCKSLRHEDFICVKLLRTHAQIHSLGVFNASNPQPSLCCKNFPGATGSTLIPISGTSGALWSCPRLGLNPQTCSGRGAPKPSVFVQCLSCSVEQLRGHTAPLYLHLYPLKPPRDGREAETPIPHPLFALFPLYT